MKQNWLDPLNKVAIQKAVRAKDSTVTIRDGRVFNLTYEGDLVKLAPVKGLVPFGWIAKNKILDPDWPKTVESGGKVVYIPKPKSKRYPSSMVEP